MSEWCGECGHVAHIAGDTLQSAVRQLQTVVEGIVPVHLGQVLGVGLQDFCLIIYDSVSNGIEYLVAPLVA